MTTPGTWQFILLALAAWRTFALLSYDTVIDGPRNVLCGLPWDWKEGDTIPRTYRARLGDFIQCPYCLGFWVGCGWWGFWLLTETWSVRLAAPWAISAGVVITQHWLNRD